MQGIRVELSGEFKRARAVRAGDRLTVDDSSSGAAFTLPRLGDYELVVLE